MPQILQIGASLVILALIIALHVDQRLPKWCAGRARKSRRPRAHDALRLTNL